MGLFPELSLYTIIPELARDLANVRKGSVEYDFIQLMVATTYFDMGMLNKDMKVKHIPRRCNFGSRGLFVTACSLL
jgi:hypothetical protein